MVAFFLFHLYLKNAYSLDQQQIKIITFNNKKYILFHDIVTKFDIESSYDVVAERGRMFHKNHYAMYATGLSVIIIDGKLKRFNYCIRRNKGALLFPAKAAIAVLENFYPGIDIKFGEDAIRITDRPLIHRNEVIKNNQGMDKITFIVIDAGHGGKDPGALGGRLKEKDITLKIAKDLGEILTSRLKGIKIRYTRYSDTFVELSGRTRIANKYLKKNQNGIFISVHVNASISPLISGFETYFLSQNPSNDEARSTAALENNVIVLEERSQKKYGDIDYVEAIMLTTQIQRESSLLAKEIQHGMTQANRRFKSRGVRKADFFVLRGALMPAALVEVGFITNQREANYLTKRHFQKKMAEGIARGTISFIKKYNKLIKNR